MKYEQDNFITFQTADVGVTIFTVMSKLAPTRCREPSISRRVSDFDVSAELRELVAKYMALGHNQYASMQGIPSLRQRIFEKTKELYGAVVTIRTGNHRNLPEQRKPSFRPSRCGELRK